jgi:hypothetical protein
LLALVAYQLKSSTCQAVVVAAAYKPDETRVNTQYRHFYKALLNYYGNYSAVDYSTYLHVIQPNDVFIQAAICTLVTVC